MHRARCQLQRCFWPVCRQKPTGSRLDVAWFVSKTHKTTISGYFFKKRFCCLEVFHDYLLCIEKFLNNVDVSIIRSARLVTIAPVITVLSATRFPQHRPKLNAHQHTHSTHTHFVTHTSHTIFIFLESLFLFHPPSVPWPLSLLPLSRSVSAFPFPCTFSVPRTASFRPHALWSLTSPCCRQRVFLNR